MRIQLEAFRVNESRLSLNYPFSTYLKVLFMKLIVFTLKFVELIFHFNFINLAQFSPQGGK